MSAQILLIDDDEKLSEMIASYLGQSDFQVTSAATGSEGLHLYRSGNFAGVILDLMLPDTDGLTLCKQMKADSGPPIIMLTANGDPMDRVIGLEMGADDYLPKPFEPRELLARIRAILRRGQSFSANNVLRFGRLEIDRDAVEARLDGVRCDLSPYQFQILEALAARAGRVLSRNQLMVQMQGVDLEAFDRSIDVHVSRIRSAIEDNSKEPRRILTIRGIGYLFARNQD
ncbi:response regulator transcription factor [Labrenzia sp. CE80]|uniref:response regulator transcription factor n=1 Tax=Labrenzia sp. CE80 TaxID=1788986 RepID=UPI00129BE4E0|nr:response regulator transcription factor [Labrenzia sp. CE80]